MACWSNRGCDDEMQATCPHAIDPNEKCPVQCNFSRCTRPTHKRTSDPFLVFDPDVDRSAAQKEVCHSCEFFLTNGPRLPRAAE